MNLYGSGITANLQSLKTHMPNATQEKIISAADYLYSLECIETFSEKNEIPEHRHINKECDTIKVVLTQLFSTQLNLFSSILKLHTTKLHSSKFLIFGLNKILN
jgi:hypothetical protein